MKNSTNTPTPDTAMKTTPHNSPAKTRTTKASQRGARNPDLGSLSPSERNLARLAALFPPEGAETFVLRHLWTDYLGEPAESGGKETFDAALRRLVRRRIVSVDETGDAVRTTPAARLILRRELGDGLAGEAGRASDFLSAWLGFSPFSFREERLRRTAAKCPLGRLLVEELDGLDKLHARRVSGMMRLPPEKALDACSSYRPGPGASPLERAEFLEYDDGRVFADRDPDDVAREFRDAFSRRHWVYAYQNRGYGPLVDALFAEEIAGWNFFDRLACLRDGADASDLFADRPDWRAEAETILRRLEDRD